MSKASVAAVGAGIGQGFINAANIYSQHKMKEVETSRVRDLLNRLEGASDIEKVQIYGEIDPKLALSYELGKEKEKTKLQTQQFIANEHAKDFGGAAAPEAIEPPGLGGEQGKVVQPLNQGDATATQTGFTPNAPNRVAQNATALNTNAPFSKNFMGQPLTQVPQGTAPPQQTQQPPKQQLTPKQEIQRLRAKGGQLNAFLHGAGDPYLAQAKGMEQELLQDKQFDKKELVRVDKQHEKTYEKITHDAEDAQSHLLASEKAREVINQGKVGTKGIAGLKRAFFKGSKWEDYFKNEDHALLEAAAIEDYSGMKSIFGGGKISDADLKVVSSKVVSPYKSDAANLAIIDYRQFQDRMKIAKAEIADEIIAQNGGYKPSDFNKQIRERMNAKYADEANRVIENAIYEGKPSPKPSPQDPNMESVYGKVPEGQIRLKKGSEVITIPAAYLQDALADEFVQLGGSQ